MKLLTLPILIFAAVIFGNNAIALSGDNAYSTPDGTMVFTECDWSHYPTMIGSNTVCGSSTVSDKKVCSGQMSCTLVYKVAVDGKNKKIIVKGFETPLICAATSSGACPSPGACAADDSIKPVENFLYKGGNGKLVSSNSEIVNDFIHQTTDEEKIENGDIKTEKGN